MAIDVTRWTLAFDGLAGDLTAPTLRSALLEDYRRDVCPRERWNLDCGRCELVDGCSYGRIFALRPADVGVLRGLRALPRPYLFRPDRERRDRVSISLVGSAAGLLPGLADTMRRLGRRGLAADEPPFRIVGIERLHPDGWKPCEATAAEPIAVDSCISGPSPRRAEVRFLTPTRILQDGRAVRAPRPGPVLRRLRDRLSALSAAWCGGPLSLEFKALGDRAEEVRLLHDGTRWVRTARRSAGNRNVYPLSGFTGTAVWSGLDEPLWALLAAGQQLGVGKGCPFGNGWYTAHPLDRSTPA